MGNERIYTHQRQERQEEYATFLALPEIAPLHSDLESTRENLVAVTENVQMLKAEDSSKRADAQKQMTLLQEEIQRFSPATPSRLPRDPRKEIATGDTQAVKDRTRVLLGLVRTTHPLPLRLLARLLSRPHHPKLDVLRQELSDFERQLELETDTQADSLSKLEEQKVLFRNEFDLAEARFHDELLPWAAETPDRSALYGKLYSTRAIDAIQAYMQNCLDDLEPNDFLRYIHWTIGQVEENRWNQNVMHAFDAFLRPFFPGLVAEDIFSWKKEGGVEGVQGLLRAYFRPAELASIESAERPVDQETRVDLEAFFAQDILQLLHPVQSNLSRLFPPPQPWFLSFQSRRPHVQSGASPQEAATSIGERTKNKLAFRIRGTMREITSFEECSAMVQMIIDDRPFQEKEKLTRIVMSLAAGCHRAYPGLGSILDAGVKRRTGATLRLTNRFLRRHNLRVLCNIHPNKDGSRTLEVVAILPRDEAYR